MMIVMMLFLFLLFLERQRNNASTHEVVAFDMASPFDVPDNIIEMRNESFHSSNRARIFLEGTEMERAFITILASL